MTSSIFEVDSCPVVAGPLFYYAVAPAILPRMSQAMRMLLAEGLITRVQLEQATRDQAQRGGTIDYHLVAGGLITETESAVDIESLISKFAFGSAE